MKDVSRYLSLLLRHNPEKANLKLDDYGWCNVEEVLTAINCTKQYLDKIVAENNKQRFRYNEDETKIKANQGHSIRIKDDFKQMVPPGILYHGTTKSAKKLIDKSGGLKSMNRNHVHLSQDIVTAKSVGMRYAKYENNFCMIRVYALDMHNAGHIFYLSENGVWLTDHVPSRFLY